MPDTPYPLDQPTVRVLLNQQTRTVGFRLGHGDSHVTITMAPSAAITMGLQMVTAANSLLFPGSHQVVPPRTSFPVGLVEVGAVVERGDDDPEVEVMS